MPTPNTLSTLGQLLKAIPAQQKADETQRYARSMDAQNLGIKQQGANTDAKQVDAQIQSTALARALQLQSQKDAEEARTESGARWWAEQAPSGTVAPPQLMPVLQRIGVQLNPDHTFGGTRATQASDAAAARANDSFDLRQQMAQFSQQMGTDRFNLSKMLADMAAQRLHDAEAAKANKPITLSERGKASRAAIETAGPMTDQVLNMILQEAPDIETNPTKYNNMHAKGTSLLQQLKYKAGFYDQSDPRQQIISLLQPIQAGQYLRSSRSQQMLALALQHMADPSQTLLTQYQRAKELKALMPEMLEGIVRSESPIDAQNPLAGSYFQGAPVPPVGGGQTPAAPARPANMFNLALPPKK